MIEVHQKQKEKIKKLSLLTVITIIYMYLSSKLDYKKKNQYAN
jgi:hypothetical protein